MVRNIESRYLGTQKVDVREHDIDRNPLRARLVRSPAEYPWSNARFYLNGMDNPLVTRNPLYEALGMDESERPRKVS